MRKMMMIKVKDLNLLQVQGSEVNPDSSENNERGIAAHIFTWTQALPSTV